jgi:hypothetical protein
MSSFSANHYEQAFESWLIDNHIKYVPIDESKKAVFGRVKIKSFDFLVYPRGQQSNPYVIITEVKGKLFKGTSLAGLKGLECWVLADDVDGMVTWQKILGPQHFALIVFAYCIVNPDVDFDGRSFHEYDNNRYVFLGVTLDDYRKFMKQRSPRWRTVTLGAEKFRQCAVKLEEILF